MLRRKHYEPKPRSELEPKVGPFSLLALFYYSWLISGFVAWTLYQPISCPL